MHLLRLRKHDAVERIVLEIRGSEEGGESLNVTGCEPTGCGGLLGVRVCGSGVGWRGVDELGLRVSGGLRVDGCGRCGRGKEILLVVGLCRMRMGVRVRVRLGGWRWLRRNGAVLEDYLLEKVKRLGGI